MAKKKSAGLFISRKGMFIWIGILVFIAGWMFVLGVIVGRGAAPLKLEVGKLERELAFLKAKMLKQEQAKLEAQVSGAGQESSQLGFYEALISGKAEPIKSIPQAPVVPKPASKPPTSTAESKPAAIAKPAARVKPTKAPNGKGVSKPKQTAETKAQKGKFTIQVASSKNAKSAEKLVSTLRQKGYKAYQIRTELKGKGVWYRIRVGSYKDRKAANKILAKLKARKYSAIIVRTN